MARRRSSAAEDVIGVTSRFPWWAGIVAALVAFIGLRLVASIEVPLPADSKQIGGLVIRQAIRTAAMIGQWVLPALLLVGAAVSYFKQRKREARHEDVASRGRLAPFADMSWQDFERVVGEYFRRRGFAVAETGGGADGGVDVTLTRGSDRYLVQCKHWRALRVGVEPVRELYGVIHARRSAGGFVVTSGTFTDEASRFAEGREIELIDGAALAGAIRQQAAPTRIEPTLGSIGETANLSPPSCPVCKAPMQLRKASRGASAGQAFWGCSRFPGCRGTRPA